jgi:lysophospholipase L1-like esterase
LIELGGNDILGGASVDAYARDMQELFRAVAVDDRTLLMFELPLLPLQYRFGVVQREWAAKFNVRLLPRRMLAGAVAGRGHTTDGLHLSLAGHAWLATRLASEL